VVRKKLIFDMIFMLIDSKLKFIQFFIFSFWFSYFNFKHRILILVNRFLFFKYTSCFLYVSF